ncbi:MAG: GNAT family N-acetyltransferase [Pseudomonadota bacterium]
MAELQAHHLPTAYRIWLTAGWNGKYHLSEAAFARAWQASPVAIGWWEGDELVAIGRANSDGVMYAMIHDVVVDPTHRGRGLGHVIVGDLVRRLRDLGVREIQLMAAVGQVGFYEQLGFERRPEDAPGMTYAHGALGGQ